MLLEAGKKLLKAFAKKGANASIGIARDALRGENIQQAIRKRVGEAIIGPVESQPPKKKSKRTRGKNKKKKVISKVKKQKVGGSHKDIFG